MDIVNLTPHDVDIITNDGVIHIPQSGYIARVSPLRDFIGLLGRIPVSRHVGHIVGLPKPRDNTIYIVSAIVRSRLKGRPDVFAPGRTVRDEHRRRIGCEGLSVSPHEHYSIDHILKEHEHNGRLSENHNRRQPW